MAQSTSPEALLELLFAFVRTGVVKAAIDLDLFTYIARGRNTAETLAFATHADERGVRIVLNALVAQGLLTKHEGKYGLTPVVEQFLVKDSALYAGGFARITANPRIWDAIGQLGDIVRTGQPPESIVHVPDHDFWLEFSEASEQTSAFTAALVANALPLPSGQPVEVLDVAAGSGVYGFTILDRWSEARVTALDWKTVLKQPQEAARRRGVADRMSWIAGSAFDTPIPQGRFDLVLASHFVHHFPPAQVIHLAMRFIRALKPGGTLALHEWVADDQRATHAPALMFAVLMLASTARGDVYTFPEFVEMLEAAGFVDVERKPIGPVGTEVVLARRPG